MANIATTRISSKGQITIPREVRRACAIRTGQTFTVLIRKNGILIKPVDIEIRDKTKEDAWSKSIKIGLADLKAGRTQRFNSEEEFFAFLENPNSKSRK